MQGEPDAAFTCPVEQHGTVWRRSPEKFQILHQVLWCPPLRGQAFDQCNTNVRRGVSHEHSSTVIPGLHFQDTIMRTYCARSVHIICTSIYIIYAHEQSTTINNQQSTTINNNQQQSTTINNNQQQSTTNNNQKSRTMNNQQQSTINN